MVKRWVMKLLFFFFHFFFRKESGNFDNDGTPAESTQKLPGENFQHFQGVKGKTYDDPKNVSWKSVLWDRSVVSVVGFLRVMKFFIRLMEDELRVATTPLQVVFQTGGK